MERKIPTEIHGDEEIQAWKRNIRREILGRREQLSPEERRVASCILADRIIGHQWFYRSEELLIFISYGSEADTSELIEEALRTGKKVYVPRIEQEEMHFYRICSMEETEPGYKGIREPDGTGEKYEYPPQRAEHSLMIMPGVAFDLYKNRIGYGKGFYDRYLADKEVLRLRTIAIGFRCQLVERIPALECDIRPYQVIVV